MSKTPSRWSGLAVGLLLFAAGAIALISSITYFPERGGHLTTITSVQTVYETTIIWTDSSMRMAGSIVLLLAFLALGLGGARMYTHLRDRLQVPKTV